MQHKPRVAVVYTGGTIDLVGSNRLDLAWYIEAGKRLEAGELVARVPELETIARVKETPFRRMPSHAMTDQDLIDLTGTIDQLFADDEADGVVVTHGTNTLEETAYFLHLTLKHDRPVVVAGAMRPASGLSADGYLNLLNAVRVAAAAESAGLGVLVVLNDTILSARDATKTSTHRVEAFQGRDLGPLGFADTDGRILYYHRPLRRHTTATEFVLEGLTALPRVDVVISYQGADGSMIDAAAAAGARGIVNGGTGAGYPTPGEEDALKRAQASGAIVCQGSRVGSGRSVRSPGMRARGWVAADNLQPWKARILLSLALTRTTDPDRIQQMFDTY